MSDIEIAPEDKSLAPISLRSRVISACAGSLITSLVVNPFDVARVRMQQRSAMDSVPTAISGRGSGTIEPPKEVALGPRLTLGTRLGAELGPELTGKLGVTVCCKEEFWYPSTIDYCVATETLDPCLVEQSRQAVKRPKALGTFGELKSIVNIEGASTLWRGVSLQLVQSIPSNVIYFIAYEHLRDSIHTAVPSLGQSGAPLLAGGLARAMTSTVISPLELLKTRLQSLQVESGTNPMTIALRSVRDMLAVDGARSLWSGLGLTLWRDVPFSSIYWLVVEAVRAHFPNTRQSHSEKLGESFAAGLVGGVVASTATTPFDVAKTRRQLAHPSCASAHMSMPKFMAALVQAEGWSSLFVGIGPRTLKVAPACAIMITSYEMGKRFLT